MLPDGIRNHRLSGNGTRDADAVACWSSLRPQHSHCADSFVAGNRREGPAVITRTSKIDHPDRQPGRAKRHWCMFEQPLRRELKARHIALTASNLLSCGLIPVRQRSHIKEHFQMDNNTHVVEAQNGAEHENTAKAIAQQQALRQGSSWRSLPATPAWHQIIRSIAATSKHRLTINPQYRRRRSGDTKVRGAYRNNGWAFSPSRDPGLKTSVRPSAVKLTAGGHVGRLQ